MEKCNEEYGVITIQKWVRGWLHRLHNLPLIMMKFQHYLKSKSIQFSTQNEDGRINSCTDEHTVIALLVERFGNYRIKIPKHFK